MKVDGSYRKVVAKENPISAQQVLMQEAIRGEHKETMTVIERLQPMFKVDE